MFLEFEELGASISFPQVPNSDEDVASYVSAFGTDWATSACKQRAQTACRTAANGWIKKGYTVEQIKELASTHTPGRGGPRKTDAEKTMTHVNKLSPEQRAELRAMLDEEGDREAAD